MMKKVSMKTSGGTLVGIIIGLVIGLGVATLVAYVMTKTPAPFLNKEVTNKPSEEGSVPTSDPNRPLYGKTYQPESEDNSEALSTEDEQDHTKEQQDLSEIDKLVDKIAEVQASQAAPKSEIKASYYLQVGAFKDLVDAENVRAKLALIGVEAVILNQESMGDRLFRVRVGPFNQLDKMNRMRSKLSENDIDVAVIKAP